MDDFYVQKDSWIHHADPRVKLAFALASITILLVIQELPMMLVALLGLSFLYAAAHIPVKRVMSIVRAVLPVSVIMAVLRAVFYPSGPELWAWGPVSITLGGFEEGAVLGLRLIVMALAIFLWLFTTQAHAIVRGFTSLGMPYPWGLSLALALRFIPSIGQTYQTIDHAQRARGFMPEDLALIARARALLPSLVALMVSAFRESEQVARALESRAYGAPGVKRTYMEALHFRVLDAAYLALILIGAALVIAVSLS